MKTLMFKSSVLGTVAILAALVATPVAAQTFDGDCLTSNGTPGCEIDACVDIICLFDRLCCEVKWDSLCVSIASTVQACGGTGPAVVGDDGVCSPNGTPDTLDVSTGFVSVTGDTSDLSASNVVEALVLGCGNNDPRSVINLPNAGPTALYEFSIDYPVCLIDITLSTCNQANFDTQLSLFKGDNCAKCLVGADDTTGCRGSTTEVTADVDDLGNPVPTDFTVAVFGFDGEAGDFQLDITINQAGNCHGDPHFLRWGQVERDSFHGECDLVFLHADKLANGDSLDVHVRTTIMDSFSYVEGAAMRIGPDTFEFRPDEFTLNGKKHTFADLPFAFGANDEYKVVLVSDSKKKPEIRVVFAKNNYISIKSTGRFMAVSASGSPENLGASVGMLGEYGYGTMIGREGQIMDNYLYHGFEWQVRPDKDPQLFAHAREPQLPYERCRMPAESVTSRRKLRANGNRKLVEQAMEACNGAKDFQLCLDDVILTGELELAEDFF